MFRRLLYICRNCAETYVFYKSFFQRKIAKSKSAIGCIRGLDNAAHKEVSFSYPLCRSFPKQYDCDFKQ